MTNTRSSYRAFPSQYILPLTVHIPSQSWALWPSRHDLMEACSVYPSTSVCGDGSLDGTIQCSGCSNWKHAECVKLSSDIMKSFTEFNIRYPNYPKDRSFATPIHIQARVFLARPLTNFSVYHSLRVIGYGVNLPLSYDFYIWSVSWTGATATYRDISVLRLSSDPWILALYIIRNSFLNVMITNALLKLTESCSEEHICIILIQTASTL
jgi:hypothetical protein